MVKVCHYFLPTSSSLLCSLSSLLSLPCLCLCSSVQTVSVCLLDFQFRLSLPSQLLVHSLTQSCGKKAAKNLTPGSLILSFFSFVTHRCLFFLLIFHLLLFICGCIHGQLAFIVPFPILPNLLSSHKRYLYMHATL